MLSSFILFIRAFKEWKRFESLSSATRSIVFYAEDQASFVHFEGIIRQLTEIHGREVCYVTSSHTDPILNTTNPNIHPFYIGSGTIRTLFFMFLKTDCMVMTMPELEKYYIKRSQVHPVQYVYIFHSMISTHIGYRKSAFDYFDTIFCVGPYHVKEIRATERTYGLKSKQLVNFGYGRLDALIKKSSQSKNEILHTSDKQKIILVAPSWGPNGLIETQGKHLVQILLKAGYFVIVRPHPVTVQKSPEAIQNIKQSFETDPNFVLEQDIRTSESFYRSHCMISDFSGVALEYAFGLLRPVLFVDIPWKMNNPDFKDIECTPLEISIREEIGAIVTPDGLDQVPAKIENLYEKRESLKEKIESIRSKNIYNIGHSDKIGADYLLQAVTEKGGNTSLGQEQTSTLSSPQQ